MSYYTIKRSVQCSVCPGLDWCGLVVHMWCMEYMEEIEHTQSLSMIGRIYELCVSVYTGAYTTRLPEVWTHIQSEETTDTLTHTSEQML